MGMGLEDKTMPFVYITPTERYDILLIIVLQMIDILFLLTPV